MIIVLGRRVIVMGITQIDTFVNTAKGSFAETAETKVFGGDGGSYFGEGGMSGGWFRCCHCFAVAIVD
jgi:hypothetical protein